MSTICQETNQRINYAIPILKRQTGEPCPTSSVWNQNRFSTTLTLSLKRRRSRNYWIDQAETSSRDWDISNYSSISPKRIKKPVSNFNEDIDTLEEETINQQRSNSISIPKHQPQKQDRGRANNEPATLPAELEKNRQGSRVSTVAKVRYNQKGCGVPLSYSLDEDEGSDESPQSTVGVHFPNKSKSIVTKNVSYNYKGRGQPLPYSLD